MKACYGGLKVPNVPTTHSWSADKVKNLCVSGDLYIRAFNPLVIEDAVEQESTHQQQDDHVGHAESFQEPDPLGSITPCFSHDDKEVCIAYTRSELASLSLSLYVCLSGMDDIITAL